MSDLIRREDVIPYLMNYCSIELFDDVIATIPAVKTEPARHGRWIESRGYEYGFWVCSACIFLSEATMAPILYKYCPNCGAKMDGEK